jgi:2-(1,2-epoxy-1,2-dihydrophenyl)acetyl-CoA isomerase
MTVESPGVLREERRGEGLVLTLDRPRRRNALSIELVAALADRIEHPGDARAVVISGAPPVFCAGGDLDDLLLAAEQGAIHLQEVVYGTFHRLVHAIAACPAPVIAAVNGAALGAGLDLALICDLRIASSDASFASSWVGMGLVPGMGGAFLLPRVVGASRAAEICLLGKSFGAAQALEWGLINEVVAPAELTGRVDELVGTIAALPAVALARTKASLRRSLAAGLDEELATLGATQAALLLGPDFAAATSRFRERGDQTRSRKGNSTAR